MTTTVIVQAHCNPATTEVSVVLHNIVGVVEKKTLQDGESISMSVYDDRLISVCEVPKLKSGETVESN